MASTLSLLPGGGKVSLKFGKSLARSCLSAIDGHHDTFTPRAGFLICFLCEFQLYPRAEWQLKLKPPSLKNFTQNVLTNLLTIKSTICKARVAGSYSKLLSLCSTSTPHQHVKKQITYSSLARMSGRVYKSSGLVCEGEHFSRVAADLLDTACHHNSPPVQRFLSNSKLEMRC